MMLTKLLMGVMILYLIKQYSYHCYNFCTWLCASDVFCVYNYAMSVSGMISTVRQRAVNILQGTDNYALDLHKL